LKSPRRPKKSKSRFTIALKAKAIEKEEELKSLGVTKASMGSSWIEYYEFIPHIQNGDIGNFYMKVLRGKKYKWENVSRDEANQAIGGNATCTTNDPSGRKRWTKGKSPSLGAAFHQICKHFGKASNSADYGSIVQDVLYDDKKTYFKQKGRPSKELDRWKRFGWTSQFKKKGFKAMKR